MFPKVGKLSGSYCFLMEVYCAIWRVSNLQMHTLVENSLIDHSMHHIQSLLYRITNQYSDSQFRTRVS